MITNIADIIIVTDKGVLTVSKIIGGIAYDQNNDPIPPKYFKSFPHILNIEYGKTEKLQTA
jgi:hypothetical protein